MLSPKIPSEYAHIQIDGQILFIKHLLGLVDLKMEASANIRRRFLYLLYNLLYTTYMGESKLYLKSKLISSRSDLGNTNQSKQSIFLVLNSK